MSDPLDLFTLPPSGKVDTSEEAARSVVGALGGLRWRVLAAVCAAPDGLTREELCDALGLTMQTANPRLWELEGKNRRAPLPRLLEMSTTRRAGASGRAARVYRPTPEGLTLYRSRMP